MINLTGKNIQARLIGGEEVLAVLDALTAKLNEANALLDALASKRITLETLLAADTSTGERG